MAYWRADSNGYDSQTRHVAALEHVTFTNGVSGSGFVIRTPESRIAVADSPALNFGPGQDFSICAWIQPSETQTDFGIMDIVDKRQTKNFLGAVGYELCLDSGRLACQLAAEPYRPQAFSSYKAQQGPDLFDGRFHHVAVTVHRRSTSGGCLYVDGEPVLTFDPTTQAGDLSNNQPLLIGTHPDPALNAGFNGVIDEVRIYRRALSAAEVASLFGAR